MKTQKQISDEQTQRLVECCRHQSYAFDLRMVCAGNAFFTVHTEYVKHMPNGRELRKPRLVPAIPFYNDVCELGTPLLLVTNEIEYNLWLLRRGWALVPKEFAEATMKHWLTARICLIDANEVFTDVRVAAPSARRHRTKPHRRDQILLRDEMKCVVCGWEQTELTMHHVKAFAFGGETTDRNLGHVLRALQRRARHVRVSTRT